MAEILKIKKAKQMSANFTINYKTTRKKASPKSINYFI